jgi:large subunit ribosomal protein L9
MKIILKEKIESFGSLGDIIDVKRGFARNYLIPYGKAILATKQNIIIFKDQKNKLQLLETKRLEAAQEKLDALSNQTITIKVRAGEGGKLFGSVTTKDIAKSIELATQIKVEKKHIRIQKGTIRTLGKFEVFVNLHTEMNTKSELIVKEI